MVEIGFGSGLNVPFYPPEVEAVAAVEPADTGWKLAGKRLAGVGVPIDRTGLDGQSLPLPDDSCDAALSTFTRGRAANRLGIRSVRRRTVGAASDADPTTGELGALIDVLKTAPRRAQPGS